MTPDEQREIDAIAANTAMKVAAEAVNVARGVAERAAETAAKVADAVLVFGNDISYIKQDITSIKAMLDNKYVTKETLEGIRKDVGLVQRVVFGGISVVLLTVLGAVISMVVVR